MKTPQTGKHPSPEIRPATPSDLAAIASLLEASSLPTDGVREALSGFFVADDAGASPRIVGVVGLETCCSDYALLRSTAVAPTMRGTGLGRRLVERAVAEAESRGFKALYLLTTTAERYFPSFGFVTTARDNVPSSVKDSVEFRSACPASATVMSLSLGSPGTTASDRQRTMEPRN